MSLRLRRRASDGGSFLECQRRLGGDCRVVSAVEGLKDVELGERGGRRERGGEGGSAVLQVEERGHEIL